MEDDGEGEEREEAASAAALPLPLPLPMLPMLPMPPMQRQRHRGGSRRAGRRSCAYRASTRRCRCRCRCRLLRRDDPPRPRPAGPMAAGRPRRRAWRTQPLGTAAPEPPLTTPVPLTAVPFPPVPLAAGAGGTSSPSPPSRGGGSPAWSATEALPPREAGRGRRGRPGRSWGRGRASGRPRLSWGRPGREGRGRQRRPLARGRGYTIQYELVVITLINTTLVYFIIRACLS